CAAGAGDARPAEGAARRQPGGKLAGAAAGHAAALRRLSEGAPALVALGGADGRGAAGRGVAQAPGRPPAPRERLAQLPQRSLDGGGGVLRRRDVPGGVAPAPALSPRDRKSTRLNSSHRTISYAVCCLEKKKARRQSI